MKNIFLLFFILINFNCTITQKNIIMLDKSQKAPDCKKNPHELIKHGDTRIDNYYWLNDREDQNVIDYLNAENDYTEKVLKNTSNFQTALFEEIKGRIKEDDSSVPYKYKGYFYKTKFETGKEYPIHVRMKGELSNKEEVLLNVNELAKGHEYYAIGGRTISPNNKILAFGVDTVSRRKYTLHFKDLETGKLLEDKIENTTGGATWANDNKTIFYTRKDETLRGAYIFKHILGTDPKNDVLVYEEKDETFGTYVYKSKSEKYIQIGCSQTLATETLLIPADSPNDKPITFLPRDYKNEHEYYVSHFENKFFILTNWNAPNFRLMSCPEGKTSKENWTEVIAHRPDVLLENLTIFKNHLVLSERIEGIKKIRIFDKNMNDHYIQMDEDAYVSWTSANPDFNTDILRFGFASLTTPTSTFDYNMNTKERVLLKQQEVLGDFKKENYKSERIWAKSRDGVQVPISLVYHKDTKINGTAPLILYAYGSYGHSMDPYFSSTRLTALNRGFVFAIAHIRGGMEMGKQWYEDGKKLNKKNTFNDFIDCAEHLTKNKYGAKDKVFAWGGSAGGLLMGAIINDRPELWRGVIAAVPFVDVITTMLDETIPLTTGEYDEWGNPNEKKYYDYIKSYSPYDNVKPSIFPNILITTGLHDSQVQYFEPAKWTAKLRDNQKGNNLILLKTNMETGHGGASGRFKRLKEVAFEYNFFLTLAGIKK